MQRLVAQGGRQRTAAAPLPLGVPLGVPLGAELPTRRLGGAGGCRASCSARLGEGGGEGAQLKKQTACWRAGVAGGGQGRRARVGLGAGVCNSAAEGAWACGCGRLEAGGLSVWC